MKASKRRRLLGQRPLSCKYRTDWMPDSPTFWHVYTAGCGNGYTQHIHTVGGGRKTPCTSMPVERDTPCKSILLVVEMDTL
jgi:hypothetical protein